MGKDSNRLLACLGFLIFTIMIYAYPESGSDEAEREYSVGTAADDIEAIAGTYAGVALRLDERRAEAYESANSSLLGDPVRLATGEYVIQDESDLSWRYDGLVVDISRSYLSSNESAHSLGRGWSFAYDMRIVAGTNHEPWRMYGEIKAKYDEVERLCRDKKALIDSKNLAGELSKAEKTLEELDATIASLKTYDYPETAAMLVLAERKRKAYYDYWFQIKRYFSNYEEACRTRDVQLKPHLDRAFGQALYADEIAARNRFVLNDSDPEYLEKTGNGTITFIDEAGTPHLYKVDSEPVAETESRYPDGSPNRLPMGSTTTAMLPGNDPIGIGRDGRYTLERKDGSRIVFSMYGQIEVVVDRNGNRLSFSYDASGRLFAIDDEYGRKVEFERNGETISRVLDPVGRVVEYRYDASGRLAAVADAGGDTVGYEYVDGLLARIVKPDGSFREYLYGKVDGKAVVVKVVDEEGFVDSFSYDFANRRTTYENASGVVEVHSYDERNLSTKTEYADGSVRSYTYDDENRETGSIETPGAKAVVDGERDRPDAASRGNAEPNRVSAKTYDDRGNLVAVTYGDGTSATYAYDARGRLVLERDRLGGSTRFAYDAFGSVSEVAYPDGSKESFSSDAIGRVLSRTDVAGSVWTYEYDADGQMTSATDPSGKTTRYEYSNRKDLLRSIDDDGAVKRWFYDKRHLPLLAIEADGTATKVRYRADGKPGLEIRGYAAKKAGRSGDYAEDWLFRPESTTEYIYDARGRAIGSRNSISRFYSVPEAVFPNRKHPKIVER